MDGMDERMDGWVDGCMPGDGWERMDLWMNRINKWMQVWDEMSWIDEGGSDK